VPKNHTPLAEGKRHPRGGKTQKHHPKREDLAPAPQSAASFPS